MPVYAWLIFLENAIEMVSIVQTNRAKRGSDFQEPLPLGKFP